MNQLLIGGVAPDIMRSPVKQYAPVPVFDIAANVWLDLHWTSLDIASLDQRLLRLTTLLDDASLAVSHPREHPMRIDAGARHFGWTQERKRLMNQVRKDARRLDHLLTEMPQETRDDLVSIFTNLGWQETPIWQLVSADTAIKAMAMWQNLIRGSQEAREENPTLCPF